MEKLGAFEVGSGKLMLSDPCYTRGTWCHGIVKNVKNGTWKAYVVISPIERRVAQLIIFHSTCKNTKDNFYDWERVSFEVGVDSGQAGIFDEQHYPQGETGECGDLDSFYGKCCDKTYSEKDNRIAGVLNFGVVSSSGYGDGGYRAYTAPDDTDKIIAVKIVFISDEEENDED